MITVLAFVFTLGVLIVIHEYGHYRVAVACGVKVLRFSVGFGRVLWRRQATPDSTEFVVCALPLGGYVTGVQTCALPIWLRARHPAPPGHARQHRVRALRVAAWRLRQEDRKSVV